ncbi:MAG: hypothetical protein RLZZ628_974 [Bacteroidota bacterium]
MRRLKALRKDLPHFFAQNQANPSLTYGSSIKRNNFSRRFSQLSDRKIKNLRKLAIFFEFILDSQHKFKKIRVNPSNPRHPCSHSYPISIKGLYLKKAILSDNQSYNVTRDSRAAKRQTALSNRRWLSNSAIRTIAAIIWWHDTILLPLCIR